MTHKQGILFADYYRLVELLGEPERDDIDCDAQQCEFRSGGIVVWDWHGDRPVESNRRWSYWARDPETRDRFLRRL